MGRYEHACLRGIYSSGGDRQLIEGVRSMAEPRTMTIVLVHGAFAESLSNWKPVLELLLAKGYKVVAAPNQLRGVSSDAAYVSSRVFHGVKGCTGCSYARRSLAIWSSVLQPGSLSAGRQQGEHDRRRACRINTRAPRTSKTRGCRDGRHAPARPSYRLA